MCGPFTCLPPEVPANFRNGFQVDLSLERMYKFVSQIYGGLGNLGGDAEGKVVAGDRSFVSVRFGKGGREYCSGGCGRREWLGSRIIDDPASVRGEVRQFGGVKESVVESCTGPCGC